MKLRLVTATLTLLGIVIGFGQASAADATSLPLPAAPAGLQPGDPNLAAPTPDTSDAWAVTIGINDYTNLDPLQVAVADADATDQRLAHLGIPATHRLALRNTDATASNIRSALTWLASRTGDDDTAVLFIAGHATNLHGGRHAINTTDGLQVTDTDLAQLLSPIRGRVWIIMATCYGAGFDELLAPGRTLTASTDADSLSYENLDLGYSYLVHYLINAQLNGTDSLDDLDLQDAYTAAAKRLTQDFPDRLPVQISR